MHMKAFQDCSLTVGTERAQAWAHCWLALDYWDDLWQRRECVHFGHS